MKLLIKGMFSIRVTVDEDRINFLIILECLLCNVSNWILHLKSIFFSFAARRIENECNFVYSNVAVYSSADSSEKRTCTIIMFF